jgi:uncharacterized protein (TIGR02300 family)
MILCRKGKTAPPVTRILLLNSLFRRLFDKPSPYGYGRAILFRPEAGSAIQFTYMRFPVSKAALGTKRTCPETGKKFYDLNKDPIVSPYTGIAYPLTAFEQVKREMRAEQDEEEVAEVDVALESPEFVPLEDADADDKGDAEEIPDLGDDEVDIGEDAEDTFLEEEEEDEGDVADMLGGRGEGEDEV